MTRTTLVFLIIAMCVFVVWTQAHVSSGGRLAIGIDGTPAPATSFALECTLTADVDTTATAVGEVDLFNGLRTLAGDSVISFNVDVQPGVPTIASYDVVAQEAGVYHVRAQFACTIDSVTVGCGNDVAWISVSADPDSQGINVSPAVTAGLTFTNETPGEYEITYVPIEPSPMDSTTETGEGNDGSAAALVDVVLRIVRRNLTTGSLEPVVNLTVELWDDDLEDLIICGDDDLLGRAVTDEDGRVVFTNVDTGDCFPLNEIDPYIVARLDNSIQQVLDVSGQPFEIKKRFFNVPGNYDLGTYEVTGSNVSYACAAYNNVNMMWSLLHLAGYDMPKMTIKLNDSQTLFFNTPTVMIKLDTAHAEIFDVVGHEYAHAFMYYQGDYASYNAFQGFDAVTNFATGWQEGFASFLPVALMDDGQYNYLGNFISMEDLLPKHAGRDSDNAQRTQGLVARALYDLYDGHADTDRFPWQVSVDAYTGGIAPILDVLHRSTVKTGFNAFWNNWHAWGANPGQDPIRTIRLNMINLNTAPTWTTSAAIFADPFEDVVLDMWGLASDGQSRDSELYFTLLSVSNGHVHYEWQDNGRRLLLNLPTQTGIGNTSVTLSVTDVLETTNVTRNIFWTNDEGGGGGGPKQPCEYPCQGTKPPRAVLSLNGAYPNPFRDITRVVFSLPDRQEMTLAIYDVNGHRVRVLASQTFDSGNHEAQWDGKDDLGGRVPSGIYFGVLRTRGDQLSSKIVLLR